MSAVISPPDVSPPAASPPLASAAPPPDLPRFYWVPRGASLDAWPAELRAAVAAVVNPAYHELVLSALPGLPQSTGLTIVHLLWLEILDQIELGRQLSAEAAAPPSPADRETRALAIARHLRLVNAKLKASDLLHRLDAVKISWLAAPSATEPGDTLGARPAPL